MRKELLLIPAAALFGLAGGYGWSALHAPALREPEHAHGYLANRPHSQPSPMRSTRSTARDIRAHIARSSASRFRPAAVSL